MPFYNEYAIRKGNPLMKKIAHFLKNNFLAILFLLLLLWILIFDFIEQFVWETGMAFHANTIPFLFYLLLFTVLPFYLIEKIYKNKYPPSKEIPYRQRCSSSTDVLKVIFGGILKLGLIVTFPFAIFLLTNFFCTLHLKDLINIEETYIFHSDFETLPLASGVGFLLLLVWLFSKKGLIVRDYSDNAKTDFFAQGEKANLPFSSKCHIALIATIILLFTMLFPTFSYDCITEQGVIRRCFFQKKVYTWEDANFYSLRSVGKGSLGFLIEMNDGHSVFWDTSLSSSFPKETYPNQEYDFFVYLAETLYKHDVPLEVKYWDRLYDSLEFEEDKEYALKIKELSN